MPTLRADSQAPTADPRRFPAWAGPPIRARAWGGGVRSVRKASPTREAPVLNFAGFDLAFCQNVARALERAIAA